MPGPAGQHTLILQQDWGYEKGNGVKDVRGFWTWLQHPEKRTVNVPGASRADNPGTGTGTRAEGEVLASRRLLAPASSGQQYAGTIRGQWIRWHSCWFEELLGTRGGHRGLLSPGAQSPPFGYSSTP